MFCVLLAAYIFNFFEELHYLLEPCLHDLRRLFGEVAPFPCLALLVFERTRHKESWMSTSITIRIETGGLERYTIVWSFKEIFSLLCSALLY